MQDVFRATCNTPKLYIKRASLLILHIRRDAPTLKKIRFDKTLCHRITRCRAGCKDNLFMCWWKYFSDYLPPYWRKRRRKERRKEERKGGRKGVYTTIATESAHKPAADKMRTTVRNPAAPACSVKEQKRTWETRETLNADTNIFFSWKRIYDARFCLFLNTHTWLNTNEINFTAAIFPHFAHGDLLKETVSQGVKKEHKT